jgi:hypothetical protein
MALFEPADGARHGAQLHRQPVDEPRQLRSPSPLRPGWPCRAQTLSPIGGRCEYIEAEFGSSAVALFGEQPLRMFWISAGNGGRD